MPENKDDIDLEGWDLLLAAKENRPDIARALIARGDDVGAIDKEACTPLHWAAIENSSDVAQQLLKHDAEVDAKDEEGRTPLHWAALENCFEVAQLLIWHNVSQDVSHIAKLKKRR